MKAYGKLVRDKIPEIITARGIEVETRTIDGKELESKLKDKLSEEVLEVLMADREKVAEEIADLIEVAYRLAGHYGVCKDELNAIRTQKRSQNGGFEDRVLLVSTSEAG